MAGLKTEPSPTPTTVVLLALAVQTTYSTYAEPTQDSAGIFDDSFDDSFE